MDLNLVDYSSSEEEDFVRAPNKIAKKLEITELAKNNSINKVAKKVQIGQENNSIMD